MDVAKIMERLRVSPGPPPLPSLYMLSGMSKEEGKAFSQEWPSLPLERRRAIIRKLMEISEASFEVDFNLVFRLCLNDEDEEVREQALEGLWEDESLSLLRSLLGLLKGDPSAAVRAQAAGSLGRFVLKAELEESDEGWIAEVRQALLSTIRDPQEALEVRRRAIEAIAYWEEEEVCQIIEAAYAHQDHKMRASALFAMGRNLDPRWSDTLLQELEGSDPEMRYEAVRACGELELRRAVPALIVLAKGPDREVQEMALWALGQIGGEKARRALMAFCQSEDEVLAEAAEEALSELEFGEGIIEIPIYEDDT